MTATRHSIFFTLLVGAVLSGAAIRAQEDPYLEDLSRAEQSYLKGQYGKANAAFDDIFDAFEEGDEEDRPGPAVMRRVRQGLMRLSILRGGYEEALADYRKLSKSEQADPAARLLAAQCWHKTGKYEEVISALSDLVEAKKSGYEARYRLGMAMFEKGDLARAKKVFEDAIALADRESVRAALDICYIARCHMQLGGRDHMESAATLLVESIRQAPERPEARIAYAELVFEAYRESSGYPHAEKFLKKVLEQNGEVEDALLTMYRSRSFNMFLEGERTGDFLNRALSLNPNSTGAMIERAKRLIDDRLFENGAQVLDRVLQINPRHRVALSHRAAVAHLLHDQKGAAGFRRRATANRKSYAEIDRIFGDHLVALYRFRDAVPYFEAALKIEPDFVPAMHGLAKAYVYTSRGTEAAKLLGKAKEIEKGFADAWRKNILLSEKRLAEEYEVVESKHFQFVIHKSDRAVLERYLTKWYEQAYEVLGKKYGYKPTNKVRVEVLHQWVDFSVRTIGFRGFSALGACFGEFVTMVSPSDDLLRRNDFMWSATAWHEYAHVLTLALSKHRVPRWLTEGMSVYEESAKNPSWERGMLRDLLDAYHNKDLPPLRLLNRVFRGSKILFGYYQGGLVVEYLAEHHGFKKVVSMLRGYGEDKGTEAIFRETFGISSREFDRRFLVWVKSKKLRGLRLVPRFDDKAVTRLLDSVQAGSGDLDARVNLGWAYLQRRLPVEAGIQLGAVLRKNPEHPMGKLLHGELLRQRKEYDAAIAAYQAGFSGGADDFESRLNFGKLLERAGKLGGALEQYQSAKACWPQCTDQALAPQLHIARILRKQGKQTEAMMEIKSFCKTTARAFKPRMDLAAYERKLGNRASEARFLEEAIQIDPFMRSLHEQLGDAYVALDRLLQAREEYEVGLAVTTEMDRAHIGKPAQQRPASDSPEEALARGALCVKIAKVCWDIGDKQAAATFLDRAEKEAPDTEVVDEVLELRAKWNR